METEKINHFAEYYDLVNSLITYVNKKEEYSETVALDMINKIRDLIK